MVEGSSVPCNFGAEYFDSDHYSNIEIILKDGSRVKANTVILAKNSPYFKELIENKSPKVIEMDEYEAIVCKSFLKSLYSGDPGILDKSNFRQVSKLSFTCEVTWMQKECHAYFRKLLSDSRNNNSHHNKFLLEEAIAAKVYDKDCQYLDALTQQKTQAVSDQDIQAMGMMLNDMKSLPVDHLDFFIRLANKCNRIYGRSANSRYHYNQPVCDEEYAPDMEIYVEASVVPMSYSETGIVCGFNSAGPQREYCTVLLEKVTRHVKNLKKIDVKTRYVLMNLDFKGLSSKFSQGDGRHHQYRPIDPFKTAASNFFETLLDLKEISNEDLKMTLRQHMRLGN